MAEEAGMHVRHQRPVLCGQRPQHPIEFGQQRQRLRPGRQAQPAGVPAAVARVMEMARLKRIFYLYSASVRN
jgi:hypothetical protein